MSIYCKKHDIHLKHDCHICKDEELDRLRAENAAQAKRIKENEALNIKMLQEYECRMSKLAAAEKVIENVEELLHFGRDRMEALAAIKEWKNVS